MTHILIVRDSAGDNSGLQEFLDSSNFETSTASNIAETVAAVTGDSSPCLVMVDSRLPEDGAFDLCRKLRSPGIPRHIPVIIQTAAGSVEEVLKGLEAGADGYVARGLPNETTATRLRQVLEQVSNRGDAVVSFGNPRAT